MQIKIFKNKKYKKKNQNLSFLIFLCFVFLSSGLIFSCVELKEKHMKPQFTLNQERKGKKISSR